MTLAQLFRYYGADSYFKYKEGKSAARKQIQLAILTVDALPFLTLRNVAKC